MWAALGNRLQNVSRGPWGPAGWVNVQHATTHSWLVIFNKATPPCSRTWLSSGCLAAHFIIYILSVNNIIYTHNIIGTFTS